eukprot:4855091-Amphidinium_carterae.2
MLIAEQLWLAEGAATGCYLLLLLHGYLRPSEPLKLLCSDLIAPMRPAKYNTWSVILRPHERLVSSKVRAYDETVIVDQMPFTAVLGSLFQMCKRKCRSDQRVFPLSLSEVSRKFRASVVKAKVSVLAPTLCHVRHSGATADMKQRSALAVKLRGRWLESDHSMRRYVKEGRVAQQWSQLPKAFETKQWGPKPDCSSSHPP